MDLQRILNEHKLWLERCGGVRADLRYADLRYADLNGANLHGADLSDAYLHGANLHGANLNDADLSDAYLSDAYLHGADLHGADLSGVVGILSKIEYLDENFEWTDDGLIVYKSFDESYAPSKKWEIQEGSVLTEVVNQDPTINCACGVNVATLDWCKRNCDKPIWRCMIRWKWLAGIVVPYHTDGKIRASRVELIGLLED